jgi:teichuronic acid biosynthesis glycosyltransferase TuaH
VGKPLLVVCAGTSWDGVVSPDRLLATALAEHADILWVDPALSPTTGADRRYGVSRRPRPILRTLDNGMVRLTPTALPLHSRPVVRISTDALVRSQMRWALRRIGRRQPHALLACHLNDVFGGFAPQVRRVIFGTDDWVAGAQLMGENARWLARDERRQIAQADLVVAISAVLEARWRGMGGKVIMVPNGVQTSAYARLTEQTPPVPVSLPGPVVGVVGNLSERIEMSLLEALVDDGLSLLLVGPVNPRWESARFAALVERPTVQWVGRQPFEAIPAFLNCIDVGVTPYVDSEFNRASFPLKTLEYLAAGRPVVSTDLPAVRWLDTELVWVADKPHEFVAAVRAAAEQAHDPAQLAARRDFAEQHSWANRAAEIARAIDLPTG